MSTYYQASNLLSSGCVRMQKINPLVECCEASELEGAYAQAKVRFVKSLEYIDNLRCDAYNGYIDELRFEVILWKMRTQGMPGYSRPSATRTGW
jgi:hypothetical protein